MKNRINIYEAKPHLSKLINKVRETGEPYTICKNNKPVVDIVVHEEEAVSTVTLPDGFSGKLITTSFCNLHDLWVSEMTVQPIEHRHNTQSTPKI